MKNYSVILVTPLPPPYGGIASYSENLYKGLIEKNIDVTVYDTSRFDHFRFYNPDKKRNYLRIINPLNFGFILALFIDYFYFFFKILFKRNLVVHVHTSSFFGWWRSIIYVIISKILRKKTIFHVHNAIDRFYVQESGVLGKLLIKTSLKIPDSIISLSHGIKNLLSDITKKPIKPIYNGIDIKQFCPDKKYIRPYKMLFAGFVGPQKGVPDLLKALKKTKLDSTEVHLTVMGVGDLIEMKELADSIEISNLVTFTGRVSEEEKTKLFNSHHIFVLPSYGEGQPISILEGMASQMAIVSTNVGSIPEIIKRENGFLVDPGDIDELSSAILKLVRKEDLQKIGKKNREIASNTFTFDRVVQDNISNYEKVLNY
jgi:glycosyltransferase involved in cell wall biosynthesis